MSSESNAAFRSARTTIAVPDVPLDAIRRSAKATPEAPTRNRLLAGVLGGLVLVGTAAAATETWSKIHFGLGNHGFAMTAENVRMRVGHNPSRSEIEEAAKAADFPVTLPVGLPPGTTTKQMMQMGNSGITIAYNLPGKWRADHHMMWITLANPKSMSAPGKLPHGIQALQLGGKNPSIGEVWQVGGEVVMLVTNGATQAEIDHIKSAMTVAARHL